MRRLLIDLTADALLTI